jgi:hypothetical protein
VIDVEGAKNIVYLQWVAWVREGGLDNAVILCDEREDDLIPNTGYDARRTDEQRGGTEGRREEVHFSGLKARRP